MLVAQSFTRRPRVDFNETYSPVMNGIIFQYLISLEIQKHLSLQLMDVVTAYLYESLHSDIYMNVHDEIPQHVLCKINQIIIWLETIGKNVVQPTKGIPPKQRIFK
jgi:hypothetical protein